MRFKHVTFISVLLIFFCIFSCAKRGSITGGPKDETPPIFVRASPPNLSTSFKSNEIKIYFDELVKIQDVQKVIISPPMGVKPEISPIGYGAKFVRIRFKDTLRAETTYNINFGSSIVDSNESNPLPFFQYVFSTGKVLDSLSFNGNIKDATKQIPDDNISVFLYEYNEDYNDSIVYKEVPRYISNTLDSTGFEFKNIKAGKYKLIALKDQASNYTYEPKLDKIGFSSKTITIPTDSVPEITLFKEEPAFKYVRAKQISKNQFQIGYEGKLIEPELSLLGIKGDTIKTTFFKDSEKDTLNFWVKPFFKQDSLLILAKSKIKTDTITARYKEQYKDSINLKALLKTLKLKEDLIITSNTPIKKFDTSFSKLVDQDTIEVDFKHKLDSLKNELKISFEKKESTRYVLQLLPGAVTDFIENTNDTLNIKVSTLAEADYGKLIINFTDIEAENNIIQLMQGTQVKVETLLTKESSKLTFSSIQPGDYTIRVIYDENNNGVQDTGNYLEQRQPEKMYFYPKPVTVRANWDVQQDISLKNAKNWQKQAVKEKYDLKREKELEREKEKEKKKPR